MAQPDRFEARSVDLRETRRRFLFAREQVASHGTPERHHVVRELKGRPTSTMRTTRPSR